MNELRDFCVDFGLPALIIIMAFILLISGVDGEVKTILSVAAGWIFKSGYAKRKSK